MLIGDDPDPASRRAVGSGKTSAWPVGARWPTALELAIRINPEQPRSRARSCDEPISYVPPDSTTPVRVSGKPGSFSGTEGRSVCSHANRLTRVLMSEAMRPRPRARAPPRDGRGVCATGASRRRGLAAGAPRGRRRAPSLALPLPAQAQSKDPGEQRGAEHRRARFSPRLRPGASIHRGQQHRRLHAEKCRNRYRDD